MRRRPGPLRLCLALLLVWCGSSEPPGVGAQTAGDYAQTAEWKEAAELTRRGGELYREGRYAEALPLAERALAVIESLVGPEHQEVSVALLNLARLHRELRDFARAEPLYVRALSIREKVFGPDHAHVAEVLYGLGRLYRENGELARAESFLLRLLASREKALGPEHPGLSNALNELGLLYLSRRDLARAESAFGRDLSVNEKARGSESAGAARALNGLAEVYRARGDLGRAEPLLRRALIAREKELGPEHADLATTLNSLAELYREKEEYERAEPLYRRAIAIREKAYGPGHPALAASLNDLGLLYQDMGDPERAAPLFERALDAFEKALPPGHYTTAYVLNNLATVHHNRGDFGRAGQLFERALAVNEKALGPDHPRVATLLSNLAVVCEARGEYARAVRYQSRAGEVRERNLPLVLSTGSERQKLAYLATLDGETYATVSLHARSAPADAQALRLSLTTVLRRKGRALDAMSDQLSALRRRLDPRDRELLDRLSAAQSQLSALVLGAAGGAPRREQREAAARLEAEVERLEDEVSRRSAEFRAQTRPATIEQVRGALPAGAALVEFFAYRPFDARGRTGAARYGRRRYVAYVLRREGEPLWADLGEADAADAEASRLLAAMKCPQSADDIRKCPAVTEVRRLARALDERVMRPVRALAGGARHLFVSPDGALNLVPFAALVGEDDRYLVESYTLTHLTSGRDLLRLQAGAESRQPPLVFADPLFGERRGAGGGGGLRSADMANAFFPRLPGTAAEAKSLSATLPGARLFTRAEATEAALKRVTAPRVLHVATHGFFLPDEPREPAAGGTRGLRLAAGESAEAPRVENPLLRSGLALEGANGRSGREGEDGILTALEAAGLDLRGTKLVVLSACETGVGEVRNGEGVYGLRRALVLAGSESQVISLWQVSDAATRHLMVGYYRRLRAGEGRTEALRRVQLEALGGGIAAAGGQRRGLKAKASRAGHDLGHPYFWAAFIQSGDWRPMEGPAAPFK